ncbi:MAG: hypothetical protein HDR88_06690 [Bacteroides sp.]|nr:hypothetical protein [Bacteroides sp.]
MRYLLIILLFLGSYVRAFGEISSSNEEAEDNVSDFEIAMLESGGVSNDFSEEVKIKLSEPNYALVNFSGFDKMPVSKTSDLKGWVEFYDGEGNYFKKRVIVNAQGTSSLMWPKKNISIDICEDEWIGDETPDITFGKWVKQDSFHLKAYYTDYFRGLAVVAYRLYDDIIADHGDMAHPWQRAGVTDADDKARCHPDGFPVGVYLNGEFYGVFSWQLKKHRKNMGMTKDCAEHIHLDGKLTDNFFKGNIDWTQFEVRNPKTLYCQDGSKYDGDNPTEIMDETSEFYDPDNKKHVLSAKVKNYILKLTSYIPKIQQYHNNGQIEELRQEFANYFDVQGLIDYTVFSSVVNNTDGWEKNWQWFTYDGEKWYVEPYDLDMTFGNTYYGYAVVEPEYQWSWDKPYTRFAYSNGPSTFINKYFAEDLDKRYAELRKSGAINTESLIEKVRDWYYRIGEENYTLEYEKWPKSYCVQDMIINENWELAESYPNYLQATDWNDSTTYKKGDMCRAYYMVWVAKNEVVGVPPCLNPGYRDSLERVEDWIKRRIAMEDNLWNFDPKQLNVDVPSIIYEDNGEIESIYNVNGQIILNVQKGVNILRYKNGKTTKIMIN